MYTSVESTRFTASNTSDKHLIRFHKALFFHISEMVRAAHHHISCSARLDSYLCLHIHILQYYCILTAADILDSITSKKASNGYFWPKPCKTHYVWSTISWHTFTRISIFGGLKIKKSSYDSRNPFSSWSHGTKPFSSNCLSSQVLL